MEQTYRFPLFFNPLAGIQLRWRSAIAAVVMACMLVVFQGCGQESAKQVVQEIANALPAINSAVTVASGAAAALDPAAGLLILGVTAIVNTSLTELQVLCNTYAKTQDPTVLGSINEALNKIINTNASALLDAVRVTDPTSRARAQVILGGIQTLLLLAYGIYQKLQTKTQVTATASLRTFKLRQVAPYLDRDKVEEATGYTFSKVLTYEESRGF